IFAALGRSDGTATSLSVVTTIYPLTSIAREIGGERVVLTTMLPPGGSAHLHEVSASAMRKAAGADILVRVAGGLDEWAERVFNAARRDALRLEVMTQLQGGRGEEAVVDPHIWLDPLTVRDEIVPLMAEAFAAADPDGSEYYRQNAARFGSELSELHAEMQELLRGFSGRAFMSDHTAWTHFARRYGLIQQGVLESTPGHECGPREAAKLVDMARTQGISVITTTRGHGTLLAEAVAGQIQAHLVELDPLGDPDSEDRASYADIMRYNATRLAGAMREAAGP
ncbi:MAG: metal ABC transporter substrate-binding protein, partial [Bacillota bacterium]